MLPTLASDQVPEEVEERFLLQAELNGLRHHPDRAMPGRIDYLEARLNHQSLQRGPKRSPLPGLPGCPPLTAPDRVQWRASLKRRTASLCNRVYRWDKSPEAAALLEEYRVTCRIATGQARVDRALARAGLPEDTTTLAPRTDEPWRDYAAYCRKFVKYLRLLGQDTAEATQAWRDAAARAKWHGHPSRLEAAKAGCLRVTGADLAVRRDLRAYGLALSRIGGPGVLDRHGVPEIPLWPADPTPDALRAWSEAAQRVYVVLWYLRVHNETADLRMRDLQERQAEAEALIPAQPAPRTLVAPPKPAPPAPVGAQSTQRIIEWARAYEGMFFELDGRKYIQEIRIPRYTRRRAMVASMAALEIIPASEGIYSGRWRGFAL